MLLMDTEACLSSPLVLTCLNGSWSTDDHHLVVLFSSYAEETIAHEILEDMFFQFLIFQSNQRQSSATDISLSNPVDF